MNSLRAELAELEKRLASIPTLRLALPEPERSYFAERMETLLSIHVIALRLAEVFKPFAALMKIEPQPDSVYVSLSGIAEPRRHYKRGRGSFIEVILPPGGYQIHNASINGVWYWEPKEMAE